MARKLLKVGANGENTLTELDSESESSAETNRRIDRRILLGFLVSAIWITAGAVYIFGVVGWSNFIGGGMANLGSFLEGAFAPLAFLWLVLGHFIQHTEISSNTRAIKLQERNAQQLEFQSRRDTFFRMMDMVHDQLGNVIGFLYYSIEGPTGTGNMTVDQFAEERTKSSMGDYGLFIRHMIFLCADHNFDQDKLQEFFFGTEIRTRHTENFRHTFEKLYRGAHEVDSDEMLTSAIMHGSAAGRMYAIITALTEGQEIDPAPVALKR